MTPSADARRVLIPVSAKDHAPAAPTVAGRVRRFRLGRMPLYTRPDPAIDRFAHLRCGHD